MKKFSVSFPYRLEYPIQIAVQRLGLLGLVGWFYQKFGRRGVKAENIQVSERIVEMPSVHRLLGQYVPLPARVLEVGHVNSALALELASLGYQVTGIDLRPYPFAHPNLTSIQGDFLEQNWAGQTFDAAVTVSTLEHLDFNRRYGGKANAERSSDRMAIQQIAQLLITGGYFILTVPYARAERADTWFKTYTRNNLAVLLADDFKVEQSHFFVRTNNHWLENFAPAKDPEYPYDGVAIFCLEKKIK